MTSGEDRRTSGTFQCDLKPGTRNGLLFERDMCKGG